MAVASVLGFNMACAPLQKKPARGPLIYDPIAATLSAHTPGSELLPDVKTESIPLQPKVDCAVEICLAITFDDGPHADTTPALLDILAERQVRATFFMLGSQAEKNPELVRRIGRAGHEVGNHGWMHDDYTKMTPEQMMNDLRHTQEVLESAGAPPVLLFRPPFGARDDIVRQTVPLSIALWNIDPEDWDETDPAALAARVIAAAKPGGIMVLHDIKPVSVAAAPQFLDELKQHYKLVTVSELLGLTPYTPKGEFSGR